MDGSAKKSVRVETLLKQYRIRAARIAEAAGLDRTTVYRAFNSDETVRRGTLMQIRAEVERRLRFEGCTLVSAEIWEGLPHFLAILPAQAPATGDGDRMAA